MIRVSAGPGDAGAAALVVAALRRSVGMGQVAPGTLEDAEIAVTVAPDDGDDLVAWCTEKPRKLIVFGALPAEMQRRAGVQTSAAFDLGLARSARAETRRPAESALSVLYADLAQKLGGRTWRRPFERFDFTDEWNNHGYGAIRCDGSIWAVAQNVRLPEPFELASIVGPRGAPLASYAGLFAVGGSEVLWFNRSVGPIDSFEWCLVEAFLSSHGAATHPCQPVLSEVPFGFDAAVTMRLDCDEDAASAQPLRDAYGEQGVPFSLAVHTPLLSDTRQVDFIREVAASGGSILSHSMTHAANWGGDHAHALIEASGSADLLANACGVRPVNAVSPFHQTPDYAIKALVDAGYRGCIGGTIQRYPETVTARGGSLAGHPDTFAFHTQQCMLHGDCLVDGDDPIVGYRTAFDLAYESGSLFGYLDHPFSQRYAYGWASEHARRSAHEDLLAHIRKRARKPVFLNEDDALGFLRGKAAIAVKRDAGAYRIGSAAPDAALSYGVTYRGAIHRIPAEGLVLAAAP